MISRHGISAGSRHLVIWLACTIPASVLAGVEAGKPNVVIILADDLGYGDIHRYNPDRGKIPTPHLDRLADQGMRFTDAHSSSGVCSPSRYALLTGRYHWRTSLQTGIVGVWGKPLIAPGRMTIASLAKNQGYRTACIGKWHLGRDWPISESDRMYFTGFGPKFEGVTEAHRQAWKTTFAQPIPGGPTTRGFDTYFGTDVPNWPPYCFIADDRTVGVPSELLPASMLGNNQGSLPGPALPGWTFEPILPRLVDEANRFVRESVRSKQPFLLYLPLTTPHTPLAVNPEWKGKSGLDNAAADLIMETDAAVGQVLATIEASGIENDTIVLFTSDNGFARYVGANDLERRGHFPSGPLRGYKMDAFEGGHRVPFIVRWPGKVKPGSVSGQLVHQADTIATLAAIWNVPLPENAGEDSFSLLPILNGQDAPVRQHSVSCAANGTPAFRSGSWKLILATDGDSKQPVQLYDLATDLAESRNLAADQPDRVTAMKAQFEAIIEAGRSTPGARQPNDVAVRRFPRPPEPAASKKKAAAKKALNR